MRCIRCQNGAAGLWMSRLWPEGEPIAVHLDEQGRPTAFTWCRRRHRLLQVQQHWQVDVDWWSTSGRARREYLAVTTVDGLFCVIYHDLGSREWRLAKVYD
jgi:hypothetical protein